MDHIGRTLGFWISFMGPKKEIRIWESPEIGGPILVARALAFGVCIRGP